MVKVKRIGIVAKKGYEPAIKAFERLRHYLRQRNVEVIAYEDSNEYIPRGNEEIQLLITLGGDGTILRAARMLKQKIPLFAVNAGGRGILCEVKHDELHLIIDEILEAKFGIEKRMKIDCKIDDKSFTPALNEVLCIRSSFRVTPTFFVKSKEFEIRQRMDGLMISTPTGSTGHSFSFGGPIVHQGLEVFILTPIAPIERLPSIILPPNELEILCTADARVIIDGQEEITLDKGKRLRVRKSKDYLLFARLNPNKMSQLKNLGID
jgi:NAD+ kinase